MIRLSVLTTLSLGLVGCVTIAEDERFSFDGEIYLVDVDVEKGRVTYSGSRTATGVDVEVTSWASAGGKAKAQAKHDENEYSAVSNEGVVTVLGNTTYVQAGIDVETVGPEFMDLQISTSSSMWVADTIGMITANANSVTLTNFEGDAALSALSSLSAEIYPYEQGVVTISAGGDCIVYLPQYAPLDLRVTFDPEQESIFDDLGFDDQLLTDGYYEAMRNPADIAVDVNCGGSVEIRQHPTLSW